MSQDPSNKVEDVIPAEAGIPVSHPKLNVLLEMLREGVHFGHRTSRWSPKMYNYVHGTKGTIHVINLESTLEKLEEAEAFVENLGREGKTVLFVGTKPSACAIIESEAKRCLMPHVVNRWLGGTLTNFSSLSKRLKYLDDLEAKKQRGELAKYTKKERVDFDKELAELEEKFGGIRQLTKIPDALFIVDITKETTAVREAKRMRVPTIALVDTNADPTLVTHPIPANDDAITAVSYIVKRIADAILKGKSAMQKTAEPEQHL
ncbi:MAG: 30S ribosomal protein S2 [bacterium]|nr:30S ribosomal protein S2 [bacterium]